MDKITAKKRAKELVAKMTVEERMTQLLYNSPAIERLGIKEYNWWNEAAHGVARAGTATVFPHAIAMAATFNPETVNKIGDVISTEGRAKYNKSIEFGDYDIFKGLTYWTPNINIFRDPRWGRGQETYGEDPFLTATLGSALINGIQGEGEFLKASACSKHFAGHSGPEGLRHGFDAIISMKDLHETYLPAFEHTVKNGVSGVMGAYNRTNGEACCAHSYLLSKVLRKDWSFDGYVVSDCWAIADICGEHHIVETKAEAAALALKNTCDLNCGETYEALVDAYEQDLVTEEEITECCERLYTIRHLLGEFEEVRPYSDIPFTVVDCKEHRAFNLKAAEECVVMLKNEDGFLPLDKNITKRIAVVGPNALSVTALEGNYFGHASEYVTVADGIRRVFSEADIAVTKGANYCIEKLLYHDGHGYLLSDGLAAASTADITVLALGLDCHVEGEDMAYEDDFIMKGDRRYVNLPKTQIKLAEAVCDVCENVIVVIMCGSAVDLGEKVNKHAKAILHAWYPGAQGGLAVANILSGKASPSGRLPVTVYSTKHDIPEFEDYSMKGRTYRFIEGEPLFPFGFGLSYADFAYSSMKVLENSDDTLKVSVDITNNSDITAGERAQLYAEFTDSRTVTPHFQLCGISAVILEAGETKTVTFDVDKYWIKAVLEDGARVNPDGKVTLYAGGHQPDSLSNTLSGYECTAVEL
ncbi:MAG: glycoside hydrolase family 3 C-terminal domain-containing protein [Clostridia bacterium]|nr:glycoside hydrolase family 3 C-terminal domain-containing protein [Clostridia bacterium]